MRLIRACVGALAAFLGGLSSGEPSRPHCEALLRTNGPDGEIVVAATFIAADRVIVPLYAVDRAVSAELIMDSCVKRGVAGVAGDDEEREIAVLGLEPGAAPGEIARIAGEPPAPGPNITIDLMVRVGDCGWMVAPSKPFDVGPMMRLRGSGDRLRFGMSNDLVVSGSPVFTLDRSLCGVYLYEGSGRMSDVAMVSSASIPASARMVPIKEFGEREVSAARRAARVFLAITSKRVEEQIDGMKVAVKECPECWRGWRWLGIQQDTHGDREEALASLRRAVELEPGYGDSQYSLGLVLYKAGRAEESIAHFRRAIELDPGYDKPRGMLAVALRDGGRLDEAIAEVAAACALDPKQIGHTKNLALMLKEAHREKEIPAAWKRVVDADPENPVANEEYVAWLTKTGDFAGADAASSAALKRAPDNVMLLAYRALAMLELDRIDEASEILQTLEKHERRPEHVCDYIRRRIADGPKKSKADRP